MFKLIFYCLVSLAVCQQKVVVFEHRSDWDIMPPAGTWSCEPANWKHATFEGVRTPSWAASSGSAACDQLYSLTRGGVTTHHLVKAHNLQTGDYAIHLNDCEKLCGGPCVEGYLPTSCEVTLDEYQKTPFSFFTQPAPGNTPIVGDDGVTTTPCPGVDWNDASYVGSRNDPSWAVASSDDDCDDEVIEVYDFLDADQNVYIVIKAYATLSFGADIAMIKGHCDNLCSQSCNQLPEDCYLESAPAQPTTTTTTTTTTATTTTTTTTDTTDDTTTDTTDTTTDTTDSTTDTTTDTSTDTTTDTSTDTTTDTSTDSTDDTTDTTDTTTTSMIMTSPHATSWIAAPCAANSCPYVVETGSNCGTASDPCPVQAVGSIERGGEETENASCGDVFQLESSQGTIHVQVVSKVASNQGKVFEVGHQGWTKLCKAVCVETPFICVSSASQCDIASSSDWLCACEGDFETENCGLCDEQGCKEVPGPATTEAIINISYTFIENKQLPSASAASEAMLTIGIYFLLW